VTLPTWTFTGGKTTVIEGLDGSDTELADWYHRVVEFISKIVESPKFEVKDNGYRKSPGVLVTNGVKVLYRGKPFEVWTDVAGELIFRHEGRGSRLVEELVVRLGRLWA
jgi:hypothetical protein